MLDSTMMDYQLTIPSILERARQLHPTQEIVSVMPVGVDPETKAPIPGVHRTTFRDTYPRVMQLCNALVAAGVQQGDRVATMALNTYRHYELYFAVPSMGAVCHMVNIRLPLEQIAYILNHAEDRILFIENVFAGMIPLIRQHAPKVQTIVVLGPVPGGLPAGCVDYEAFLAGQPTTFRYPYIDERQASGMCYTSGTTGNPKGVLYSHRAITLHSLASLSTDLLGVNSRECIIADRAAVPRQWMGISVHLRDGRREAGVHERVHRREEHRALHRRGGGDRLRRRADDLPRPAGRAGQGQGCRRAGAPADAARARDRRIVHAARADRRLRRPPRHPRDARLGHDRDHAARHRQPGEAGGHLRRRAAQVRPHGLQREDVAAGGTETAGRCRCRAAVGHR